MGDRDDRAAGIRGRDGSADRTGRRPGPSCPICEASLFKRHCKYVCPQHGVVYDCSDPFS